MDETLATIIVACIGFAGAIGAALIAAKRQVSKDMNKLSDSMPSWKLLYEHDENGVPIKGTVTELIDAAGKAYPIKVKIYQSKDRFDMMNAQWVLVNKNTVYATNTEQISLGEYPSGTFSYTDDMYHYFLLVNSEGFHQASRVYIDGRKAPKTDGKRRMAWFGLLPPLP